MSTTAEDLIAHTINAYRTAFAASESDFPQRAVEPAHRALDLLARLERFDPDDLPGGFDLPAFVREIRPEMQYVSRRPVRPVSIEGL